MRPISATACFESPIGIIQLRANESALLDVKILPASAPMRTQTDHAHPILSTALAQIEQWFNGDRITFELPLVPLTGADGQLLRNAIADIPYGETRSYGAVAAQCGSIARAVGQACKTNAYPLIIPCHRVTSAAGPEYYSAGDGPRTKSWLLDFEYNHLPPEKRTRLL